MGNRKLDPFIMKSFSLIAPIFVKLRITPNYLTLIGAILSLIGVYYIALGKIKLGIIIVIFTWLFDVLDGALAKYTSNVTKFGGFFDSVIDRYTEGLVLGAFAYYYSLQKEHIMVLIVMIAIIGSLTVPYARARAEKEIPSCSIGIGDRLIRLLFIAFFTLINFPNIGIIIVMIISHITVLQRILYTKKFLRENKGGLV